MKKILKSIFDAIPFKKQFFGIIKIFKPGPSIYKHLHFKGIIKVRVDDNHAFKMHHYGFQIENELFWNGLTGGWEKVSLGLWVKLSKNADVIIDVGANTGIYSLIAKAINKPSLVYAFEPVERVFNKLEENNLLNGFDVHCYQTALSNSTGTAAIYDIKSADHIYSVTVNKNLNSSDIETIKTEIQTITLDDFIEQNKLSKIDLIKIDVETHEAEVLEGFSKYMNKFHPTILIEILNDEVGANVQKIVSEMGYLYFNIDENAGIRQVNAITQSDYYNYLLCTKEIAKELKLI